MLEGLPPHRPTHVLRLTTDATAARAATELLGEVFDPTESAVAAFEAADGRTWLLEAYFAFEPDEAAIRELVRPLVGDAAAEGAAFETLERRDWVQASLEGLTPVRAGRILVHGAHDRARVRPNDWPIEIEAALAFGTGHHGTTLGCLLALVDVLRRRPARTLRVLDVGTGTGILALAAARVGAGLSRGLPVVAGDLDPEAIATARGNAALNGLSPRLALYHAPGARHRLAARPRGFDLVFANILARPLTRLAPSLAGVVAGGGTLVLSGLLVRDVPGVLAAYAAQGFRLRRRRVIEGWASLALARGGAAARPLQAARLGAKRGT